MIPISTPNSYTEVGVDVDAEVDVEMDMGVDEEVGNGEGIS